MGVCVRCANCLSESKSCIGIPSVLSGLSVYQPFKENMGKGLSDARWIKSANQNDSGPRSHHSRNGKSYEGTSLHGRLDDLDFISHGHTSHGPACPRGSAMSLLLGGLSTSMIGLLSSDPRFVLLVHGTQPWKVTTCASARSVVLRGQGDALLL